MLKKKVLPILLSAAFIFCMLPVKVFAAAVYDAGTPEELSAALGAASGGGTIRLTADIDYDAGIVINGRSITFDLNGHTLNVASSTGHGLEVGSGGDLDMTGNGELNVTSSADHIPGSPPKGGTFYFAVYAHDGGRAKATSAASTGHDEYGVNADGTGSRIELIGDAAVTNSDYSAVLASNGGYVGVGGSVKGGYFGAVALDYSYIEVAGSVAANDEGILAGFGGTVEVGGNVTASGEGAVGVHVNGGGEATVSGEITAPVYIRLSLDDSLTADQGVQGTGDNAGFLVYTDGSNTVRVKIKSPASSSADGAALDGAGMTAYPLSDTQVELEKEVIEITVRAGCSRVTSTFWFHNTGESVNLLFGFPTLRQNDFESMEEAMNAEDYGYNKVTQLNWFRIFVNGKRVRLSVKKGLNPEGSSADGLYFPEYYTWRMHFAAGERIKVVNKYWFVEPAGGIERVRFMLRSGAAWKGPVGKLTVRMEADDFKPESTFFHGMKPSYIEEDGTTIWEAENIEPDEDIIIDSMTPYGPSGISPFSYDDDEFQPYQTMSLRMLRNFYAGHYNGTTWWGNRMLRRFGDTQSSQLYYCMGVSYYKLGYTEKALDMFGSIHDNDELYGAMAEYYKALICEKAGDDAGYRLCLDSVTQYLSGIPEGEMSWGAYWLKSRLADLSKPQPS